MINDLISLLTSKRSLEALITANHRDTGFSDVLLEKDYYLTIFLLKLAAISHGLVFKGGTCLNKCYLGYYRLSEDLDFVHFASGKRKRNERRNDFRTIEEFVREITAALPGMECVSVNKYDAHQQMRIDISYESLFIDEALIKFEVTHRYSLYYKPESRSIKNLFRHPVTGRPYQETGEIPCITLEEAAAEKVRACLTRKEPAVRDFFDLWYIKHYTDIDFNSPEFAGLAKRKISESTGIIEIDKIHSILKKQIKEELKPTLNKDYTFDLKGILSFVTGYNL